MGRQGRMAGQLQRIRELGAGELDCNWEREVVQLGGDRSRGDGRRPLALAAARRVATRGGVKATTLPIGGRA